MRHRADIDGLRALAILPVVVFHFGLLGIARGGFVGVDIFFVISGYLITSIIYSDVAAGTYSIAKFYSRRIRRIFPALFAVFGFCILATFFLAFPSEARDTGKTVIGAIFFISNIAAYHASGYFEQQSGAMNPLLHTWSLSVEEQFYLLFPLVVFALRRFSHAIRAGVLAAIAVASFIAAVRTVPTDPHAAFYLMQYRAWELSIGALLAIGAVPKPSARWQAEALGLAGIALILASVELISEATPFPGLAALAPCLGAAAIIQAGTGGMTWTGRLLGFAPLRFIGLISYSLYLWHWPVIVFVRYFREPSRWEKVVLIALCIALATLSWKFIEQPFRDKQRGGAYRTLKGGGLVMAATALCALFVGAVSTEYWDVPPRAERILAYTHYNADADLRAGSCFLSTVDDDVARFKSGECLALQPGRMNVLLMGDSHAADLGPGLRTNYPQVNFLQATASGCKPVLATSGRERCTALMRRVFDEYLPTHRVDGIILSADWASEDAPLLQATVTALHRYADQVYVFGPIAEYRQPLPRLLARGIATHQPGLAIAYRTPAPEATDRLFAAVLADSGARYVSVYRTLCDPDCVVWAKHDVPLMFDIGHLTRDGSILLVSRLRSILVIPPPRA